MCKAAEYEEAAAEAPKTRATTNRRRFRWAKQ